MTLSEIKTAVCQSFEIEESDFVIFGRSYPHSYARFSYFVLCRKYTFETQKSIGDSVQMKYTSVQNAIKRHPELMKTNPDYKFNYINALASVKLLKDS